MEDSVVSLETARKLKEAGWLQGHPRNVWSDNYKVAYTQHVWAQPGSYREDGMLDVWAVYEREEGWLHHKGEHLWMAAPMAQEIANEITSDFSIVRVGKSYGGVVGESILPVVAADNMAEIMAALWFKQQEKS